MQKKWDFPDFGELFFVFCVCFFDSLAGGVEIIFSLFDADERSAEIYCGNARRAAAHERIDYRVSGVGVGFHKPLHAVSHAKGLQNNMNGKHFV